MTTRADAEALDRADPLAALRDQFVAGRRDVIYLDGNSLGRPSRTTADRIAHAIEHEWAGELVEAWDRWIDLPAAVGDELAASFLGAGPGQVLVCDSTTVNLYKLASAALDANPDRSAIVTDEGNFPTNRYVLEGLAEQRGVELRHVPTDPITGVALDALRAAVDSATALVSLSHVSFSSGALVDMAAANDIAHGHGALTLWDLSHAVGAVPVALDATDADLAVGCTYKYLNAGPGAPAFLYVRDDLAELRSPVWGWFAQRDQFTMGPRFDPVPGVGRFAAGTPPVLGLYAVQAAVRALAAVGIDALRAKSTALTELLIVLVDERLAALGFEVASPRTPEGRGGHVAVRHGDAYRIGAALRADAAVVADVRPPDRLRLAPVPAYTRFVDVFDAVDRIALLVAAGGHRGVEPRTRVT